MLCYDIKVYKNLVHLVSIAHAEGFMRSGGNISQRLDKKKYMITPHGCIGNRLGKVKFNEMCRISYDGTNLTPHSVPSNEVQLHTNMYQIFPEIKAIFHAHTPNILGFVSETGRLDEEFFSKIKKYGKPIISSNPLETLLVNNAILTNYGVVIIVPEHGVFVGSFSLENALYLVCKYDDVAKFIINKRICNRSSVT